MGWEDKLEKLIPKITAQVAEQLKLQLAETVGPVTINLNVHVGDVVNKTEHKTEINIPEGMSTERAIELLNINKEIPAKTKEDISKKEDDIKALPEREQRDVIVKATTHHMNLVLLKAKVKLEGKVTPEKGGRADLTVTPASTEESPVKPVPSTDLPPKDKS